MKEVVGHAFGTFVENNYLPQAYHQLSALPLESRAKDVVYRAASQVVLLVFVLKIGV